MASSTFYNDIEVKGVVKTSLAGKLIGTVTEMPAASSKNSGCAVLYVGASGTYVPGTIYLSSGTAWTAQGKVVTVDSMVSSSSSNPVSGSAVASAISAKQPIVGSSLSVTWASDTSVSGFFYKGTISLSGVTADHVPIVTFDTAQARSGNYCAVAESGTNAVYIWSKVNTAITIPSVVATLS